MATHSREHTDLQLMVPSQALTSSFRVSGLGLLAAPRGLWDARGSAQAPPCPQAGLGIENSPGLALFALCRLQSALHFMSCTFLHSLFFFHFSEAA